MNAPLSASDEVGRQRQHQQVKMSTERLMGDEFSDMDQEARDLAKEAKSKIQSHEQLCTERWDQSRLAMERLEVCVEKVQKAMDERIGKIPASIIAALTGLVGFLAARAFPLH